MKNITFIGLTLLANLSFSQANKFKFESSSRILSIGDTIELKAIYDNVDDGSFKWKIGGEEGKDWKLVKGYSVTDDVVKVYFKKIGPTNVGISGKRTSKVKKKVNGKEQEETVKESLKYDKKGYLLVTAKDEYSEFNQLFAEGTTDSYIKLVKKASKLTENEKYAKDPFAFIWLARGLYAIHGENLDYSQGKYAAYKTAFQDAIAALSKALKYDVNGFFEDTKMEDLKKFTDFIYEFQNKYFVEVLGEQVEKEQDKIDYAKINAALNKYVKITKNPICVKYYQIACMYRSNDASNAKLALKEADAQLAQLGDSASFTETDKLFFAAGVVELGKYYEFKKQSQNICDLMKRAVVAVPSLLEEQGKFEEFRERLDNCN